MEPIKTKRVKSETSNTVKSKTKNGKERYSDRFSSNVNILDESSGRSVSLKENEVTKNNKSKFKSVFKEKDASGNVILKEVVKKKMRNGVLVKDKSRIRK